MFGSKHRAEKRAAEDEAKEARARADLRQTLVNLIAVAEGKSSDDPDWPLMLQSGERLVSAITGCGLFEPRREPGHWSGRSAGVSVPVGDTGLRVRLGQSRGTYIQGAETPTVIDTGSGSVTTKRVVFQGDKYTREWDFSKLIGVIHYSDKPCTAIQVSNRQKTSGIVYPDVPSPEPLRLAFEVAIAIFHGESDGMVEELRRELAKLDATAAPGPPLLVEPHDQRHRVYPPPTLTSPAADHGRPLPDPTWAPDPSNRHQFRWWDGTAWTDFVGDNGQQSRDPLPDAPG
jgi:hypothetical protein